MTRMHHKAGYSDVNFLVPTRFNSNAGKDDIALGRSEVTRFIDTVLCQRDCFAIVMNTRLLTSGKSLKEGGKLIHYIRCKQRHASCQELDQIVY